MSIKTISLIVISAVAIASCSKFQKSNVSDRSLASVPHRQCEELLSFLMNKQNMFSQENFNREFYELGLGHLLNHYKYLARANKMSPEHQQIFNKLNQHVDQSVDYRLVLDDLSTDEKRFLWRDIVRPERVAIEEQKLTDLKNDGDVIADFLLSLPRGIQRENAESAVIMMKQLHVGMDDVAIVTRLSREMGACLTR